MKKPPCRSRRCASTPSRSRGACSSRTRTRDRSGGCAPAHTPGWSGAPPRKEIQMMKVVVGLLDSQAEAQKAVEELLNSGFRREDVGMLVVAPGADKLVNNAAKGVFLGSLAGLLLGAATMLLPGVGWVMVAGPVSTMLLGTALGAAAGGVI